MMTGRIWRTFRGAVLLLVLTSAGLLLVLGAVGRGIDAHQKTKETSLVSLRLGAARQAMITDLTAATIWDDAVARLSTPVDVDWIDHHIGPFFAAQSGHVATLAYDGAGAVVRLSMNGMPASAAEGAAFAAAAAPLVSELRRETAGRDRTAVAMAAVSSRSGLVSVNGQVYQLAVSSVVRHTETGPVPPTDPIVASFKPFLAAVAPLGQDLGLREPRFEPAGSSAPGIDSGRTPVADIKGLALGQIVWTPETPGATIMTQTLPLLAALILAMGFAGAWLFHNIASDVRRLAASEAALALALERAEAGSAAKSRFLSNVSHELRTPLNGVLGLAEILEQDLLTPRQRDRMILLKAAGRAQLRLIENLLFVTRLQSQAVRLTPAPFSPDGLLRKVEGEWRIAAVAKGLTLTVQTGGPDRWTGDAEQIGRALDALIDNAIRVTDHGSVTVSASESVRHLVLDVQDTGPGIPPEVAARLMVDDGGDRPPADGAGLGLPIVMALVAMMDGRVSLDTTLGEGSRFRIRLPYGAVRG